MSAGALLRTGQLIPTAAKPLDRELGRINFHSGLIA
jgi:hypothetical protein